MQPVWKCHGPARALGEREAGFLDLQRHSSVGDLAELCWGSSGLLLSMLSCGHCNTKVTRSFQRWGTYKATKARALVGQREMGVGKVMLAPL